MDSCGGFILNPILRPEVDDHGQQWNDAEFFNRTCTPFVGRLWPLWPLCSAQGVQSYLLRLGDVFDTVRVRYVGAIVGSRKVPNLRLGTFLDPYGCRQPPTLAT